jgi:hypothetical protein
VKVKLLAMQTHCSERDVEESSVRTCSDPDEVCGLNSGAPIDILKNADAMASSPDCPLSPMFWGQRWFKHTRGKGVREVVDSVTLQ